jgi:hypothetical protein
LIKAEEEEEDEEDEEERNDKMVNQSNERTTAVWSGE